MDKSFDTDETNGVFGTRSENGVSDFGKPGAIPVFFTIDNDFAPFASVAIMSLIEHTSAENNYEITVVYETITPETLAKLKNLETENVKLKICTDGQSALDGVDTLGNRLRADIFTLTIFFRLFLPEMFPEYDKAIYIDADTVILDDVAKLFETDLEGNVIGGVQDGSIMGVEIFVKYYRDYSGINPLEYINSGMLLLDMRKLRELKLSENFLRLYNKYHLESLCPDQDYINVLCHDKIKLLDPGWNSMPSCSEAPVEHPKIVHYNLFEKPWHYSDVNYEEYFWEYVEKSEFRDRIHEVKDEFSEEDLASDGAHFNLMVERAEFLVKAEVSFKTLFDSGEEKRL